MAYKGPLTLCKAQPRQNKTFHILSTKHHGPTMSTLNKPEIVNSYNIGKTGIDKFDQMTKRHGFDPTTTRWPFRTFIW